MPSFSFLRLADTSYPASKGIVWRKIRHIQLQNELFVKGYGISSVKVNYLLKDTTYPGPKGIAGRKKWHFRGAERGEGGGCRQAGRPLNAGEGCEKGNADERVVEVPFVRVSYAVLQLLVPLVSGSGRGKDGATQSISPTPMKSLFMIL